jgi:hypothetical protein
VVALSVTDYTNARQLPLKYTANRNMRRACCHGPCLISPAGCGIGPFDSLGFSGVAVVSTMGRDAGGCRCLRFSVVMVEVIIGRELGGVCPAQEYNEVSNRRARARRDMW